MSLARTLPLVACALAFLAGPALAQDGVSVKTETITVDQPAMPEIPAEDIDSAPAPEMDLPAVHYDPADLPEAVRATRARIMEAAATGDLEALRPIMQANGAPPSLSFGGYVDDPIAYLHQLSGDAGGREILAILIEVLEAGYVHADDGNGDESYVWPYFARYPVEALTPRQLVELFKLVYAGDYADMLAYGYYLSYRLAIAPDGTWLYFVAGD